MSSRIRSDFGTLADRAKAMATTTAPSSNSPTHDLTPPEFTPTAAELRDALPVDPLPTENEEHVDRLATPCHVWVDGTQAGLLLGWRKYPRRAQVVWFARIFWCPVDSPAATLAWVPAHRVTRA